MEPLQLNSRLSNISSYKREKSFKYPISRESPTSPLLKKHSIRDESTNPTPLNAKSVNYRPCPTDPNLILVPLPLYSSPSYQSIKASNNTNSNFESSPCKTEILSRNYQMPGLSLSNLSLHSPTSFNASPLKSSTFSKMTEKYDYSPGIHIDTNEPPLHSVRSGLYQKDNSMEISAIVEENSGSERPQASQASIVHSVKAADKYSILESESSSEYEHEGDISSVSAPVSSMPDQYGLDQHPQFGMSLRAKSQSQNFLSLSFEEAYAMFKSLNIEYFSHNLWVSSWKEKICCRRIARVTGENLEICEKIIVFTYLGFNQEDFFHSRLIISLFEGLSAISKNKENWTDLGFSCNDPYEVDLKHDASTLGLFQLLFIDRFLPELLEESLNYCLSNNMAFITIAFDISEISITILRKKLLNSLIIKSSKPVEILFFLFAGCLSYWFTLHKGQDAYPGEINYLVEKLALSNPEVLINLAKEKWESA